jgi:hypothetical protein
MSTASLDQSVAHYLTHGFITDPGAYGSLLDSVPRDLPALCHIVRGLVVHYHSDALVGCDLPPERFAEVRTRSVASMLERLGELNPRPLTITRLPECRLIGCCRDAATLVCAVLRHHGVPARVRVGFASYLAPNLSVDHWVVEWWDDERQRWILTDAEQEAPVVGANGSTFDPCDVPRDEFLVAGQAWQASRAGWENASRFGYDPEMTGLGVIRNNLLHDLACLNKMELTPWDFWGLSLTDFEQHTEDDLALLDQVAMLTQGGNDDILAVRSLYGRDPRLRVPPTVTTFTLADEKVETHIGPLS